MHILHIQHEKRIDPLLHFGFVGCVRGGQSARLTASPRGLLYFYSCICIYVGFPLFFGRQLPSTLPENPQNEYESITKELICSYNVLIHTVSAGMPEEIQHCTVRAGFHTVPRALLHQHHTYCASTTSPVCCVVSSLLASKDLCSSRSMSMKKRFWPFAALPAALALSSICTTAAQ